MCCFCLTSVWISFWQLLTGQKATPEHASNLLDKLFNTPSPDRDPVVLLVDEVRGTSFTCATSNFTFEFHVPLYEFQTHDCMIYLCHYASFTCVEAITINDLYLLFTVIFRGSFNGNIRLDCLASNCPLSLLSSYL